MPDQISLDQSFTDALESLSLWFKERDLPYSIIGGIAVAFLVNPRSTQDIDSIVWLDLDQAGDLLRSGASFGFVPRISDALEFVKISRVLLLRHQPSGLDIDISLAATPFEWEMIERARVTSLGKFNVPLPTPEDVIIMKAIAAREIDYQDIRRILAVYKNLDLKRIKYWVKQFAEVLEMPEIIENLERLIGNARTPRAE